MPLLFDTPEHQSAHGEILPALSLSSKTSCRTAKIDNAETEGGSWLDQSSRKSFDLSDTRRLIKSARKKSNNCRNHHHKPIMDDIGQIVYETIRISSPEFIKLAFAGMAGG